MNRGFWRGMMIACIIMLLILAGSLSYTESGSETYYIILLAAGHLLAAMLIVGSFLYFKWNPIGEIFE